MHGAGIFPLRLGRFWRVRDRRHRLGLHVLLWCGAELSSAALATEVSFGSLMLNACRRLRRIDLHPAHGIVLFSLLHSAIVALFAHFNLYISALSAPMTNGCRTRRESRRVPQ